jgi:O-succinylbenzoic acid--CoA ligase
MTALARCLDGIGPAFAFGPTKFSSVDPDIAIVIPTSGSTGTPKEVALSASAVLASARAAHEYLEAQEGENWSLMLPINHIAGVNVLVRAIALGTNLSESRFDYTSIVPTQLFRALSGHDALLTELKRAKAVLVGGGAIDSDLLNRATDYGINVVTTYGMSEMSGGCVYNNKPLAGVEIEIRENSQIALRGPMQATSYLGSGTLLADSSGWFVTSDCGYLRDGQLIVEGRIDDQIISGGMKISLDSIDNFLNQDGLHFISCAIPDPQWGQLLCLASSLSINEIEIKEQLRQRFGNHAVPKVFLSSIELPLTSIGKPDRREVAKRFERMKP